MTLGHDQFKAIISTMRALPLEVQAGFMARVTTQLRQHHRPGDAEVAAALRYALLAIDEAIGAIPQTIKGWSDIPVC